MSENKAEKSLRWLVNQIPDFEPKTNEEKFILAVKLYCDAGGERNFPSDSREREVESRER